MMKQLKDNLEEDFEKKLTEYEEKAKHNIVVDSASMPDEDYKAKFEEEMADIKDQLEEQHTIVNTLSVKERKLTDQVRP